MAGIVIGHEAVRAELERELSPVTLLTGPASIGKATLAGYLVRYHAGYETYCERLTANMAREIVIRAPIRRASLDVHVIEMDEATEAAQNILLKVLEEPPPHCRFILVSSRAVLPTVASRARVYRLGMLTDAQVAQVLLQEGVPEHEAPLAASRGRGQVAPALEAVADRDASRVSSVVAAAVRAAAGDHAAALSLALRNWTPEHTRVLARWAVEAASGRWVHYTGDFAPGVSRGGALRMLYVLSTYDARTGPAVALETLKEKS